MTDTQSIQSRVWHILRVPVTLGVIAVTFPISIPLLIQYRRRHGRNPKLDVSRLFKSKKRSEADYHRRKTDIYRRYLWSGCKVPAFSALDGFLSDANRLDPDTFSAARAMASRLDFDDEPVAASAVLDRAAALPVVRMAEQVDLANLRAQLLMKLGEADAAREVLDCLDPADLNSDARLVRANASLTQEEHLDRLNGIFTDAGLSRISLLDPGEELRIDNLTATAVPDAGFDIGKVSVIFPIFNAETTVEPAVRSVCAQSYRNIEILLVDDCSTDETLATLHRLATKDTRIRVIESPQNGGAYVARNLGAAVASGKFITTHDADDWSHPEKLARQLAPFRDNEEIVATGSQWVRMTPQMYASSWNLRNKLVHPSYSSFLLVRAVFEELGPWDPVRVSGDAEYMNRVEAIKGADSIQWVDKSVPLAFGLADDASLTSMKATHVSTVYQGLRYHYHSAFRYVSNHLGLTGPDAARLRETLSPRELYERNPEPLHLSLHLIGDCRNEKIVEEMERQVEAADGMVGISNQFEFVVAGRFKPCNRFFDLVAKSRVTIVCDPHDYPSERVEHILRDQLEPLEKKDGA